MNPAHFIEQQRSRPFAWGEWDCCQYAAEWVRVATGKDHRASFPAYSNEAEAREVLTKAGGLPRLVSQFLKSVHKSQAMRGDLLLANDEGGGALGICDGVWSFHVGPDGLTPFRTASAIHAWRVE